MDLFGTPVLGPSDFRSSTSVTSVSQSYGGGGAIVLNQESREVRQYMSGQVPEQGSRVTELVAKMVF